MINGRVQRMPAAALKEPRRREPRTRSADPDGLRDPRTRSADLEGLSAGASFEDSTRRLGAIVAELEAGDLPLERALTLFEEGIRLSRAAQERLDRAEKRVEELLHFDAEGRPVTRELES